MKMILFLFVPVSVFVAVSVLALFLWVREGADVTAIDSPKVPMNGGLTAVELEQLIN